MTVMVENLDSNYDGCEQPTKESKRLNTACPIVRDTKRRLIASPSVITPCKGDGSRLCDADEDYLHFLSQLIASDSDVLSLKDDQDGSPVASDVDPDYKIFLENLKIDGMSYALKVELEGRTVLLKYESEGTTSIVVNPEILGNVTDDSKKESAQSIRSWKKTRDERDNAVNTLRKKDRKKQNNGRKSTSKGKSHKISRKIEVNQKKVALRRNSIEVEAKIASARTETFCRKEFDESLHPRSMHNSAEDEEAWDESLLAFVQCLRNDGDVLMYTLDDGRILRYEEDEEEVEANIASARTETCCRKEFDESLHPHSMHNSAEGEEAWDESLLAFVQCLRNDSDVLVHTLDDGRILRYEEDEEEDGVSDIESDVEILDREDFSSIGKNNPFVSARSTDVINIENIENKEWGKVLSGRDSEFRVGLRSELEMPYDDKEYEDLMQMVTHRRGKEVDKELRGGREVSYSLKGVCKSYLDVHKDFARALKHVKGDRKRTLNILRGFRYWLHNVPKRGSFFPWLDAQCLTLLPGP